MSVRVSLIEFSLRWLEAITIDRRLLKYYKKLNQSHSINVIFDVGANKGQSIKLYKRAFPSAVIHSFEPNRTLFGNLQKQYKNDPKVVLNNLAISDDNAEKTFHVNVFHPSSSLEVANSKSEFLKTKASVLGVDQNKLVKERYNVECNTIHTYCEKKGINKIDLLKIDIEGHEAIVLNNIFANSAANLQIELIQLEDHLSDLYTEKKDDSLTTLVEQNGYKVRKSFKHFFRSFYDRLYEKKN